MTASRSSLKIAALAFGACLLSLPALAQDYGTYGAPDNDTVTVEVPRSHHYTPPRSTIGAPIEDVGISTPVRYDDLNLTDGRDVYRLHERILTTARHLCARLDNRFPVTYSDGRPSCYRQAVDDAMAQADEAVDRADND